MPCQGPKEKILSCVLHWADIVLSALSFERSARHSCSFVPQDPFLRQRVFGMESLAPQNPAAFTAEQKEYLLGFLAGSMQRGVQPFVGHTAAGLLTSDPASGVVNRADPAEETFHGTPVSDLCREELRSEERR